MQIGTALPTFCTGDRLVPPGTIRDWARRAEDAGFAGLWTLDHLVKPHTYNTSMLDPVVVLSHAAAVTEGIDLGTSILIFPLRRTANVVSRALSVQHLSGGRLTLGLGVGYVPKEFEAVGVPMEERGPRLSEGLDAMHALFEGEASYDGRFHSFEDVRIDPVLDDPPRLLVGGSAALRRLDADDAEGEPGMPEPVLARILNADGWIAPTASPEAAAADWRAISAYAEEQGVDPDSIDRVVLQYTHLVEGDDEAAIRAEQRDAFEELFSPSRGFEDAERNCLVGSIDEIRDRLAAFEEIGFDQVIVGPAANDPAILDEQLDLMADHLLSY